MLGFMGKVPKPEDILGGLVMVGIFGGPPILVGYVLYRVGRGLRRVRP
jgi:hypothetical protein